MKNVLADEHFIFTSENPRGPVAYEKSPSVHSLARILNNNGYKAEIIDGKYGMPEKSVLVHSPHNVNFLHKLAKDLGQESAVYSKGGENEMHYYHGEKAGKIAKGTGTQWFKEKPEDYFSTIHTVDGPIHFSHNFDFDTLYDSPLNKSEFLVKISILDEEIDELQKSYFAPKFEGDVHPTKGYIGKKHTKTGELMWESAPDVKRKHEYDLFDHGKINSFLSQIESPVHRKAMSDVIKTVQKDPHRHFIPTRENDTHALRARHIKSLISNEGNLIINTSHPNQLTVTAKHRHGTDKGPSDFDYLITKEGVQSGKVDKPDDRPRSARPRRLVLGLDRNIGARGFKNPTRKTERNSIKEIALRKNDSTVSFSLGSNRAREIRDLAEQNGGFISSADLKNKHKYNLGDLQLGHLVDKQGNITSEKVQEHINSLPKKTWEVQEKEFGQSIDLDTDNDLLTRNPFIESRSPEIKQKNNDPNRVALNPFIQRHTPEKSKVAVFGITPEMKQRMDEQGTSSTFHKYNSLSSDSGHPSHPNSIGWVRYTEGDDGHIHIDEVQTDHHKNIDALSRSQVENFKSVSQLNDEQLEMAKKYHPQGSMIHQIHDTSKGKSPEEMDDMFNQYAQKITEHFDPEHVEKIHNTLFEGKKPNEVLLEAFHQHMRNKGKASSQIHIFDAPTKAQIALFRPGDNIPGHMKDTYRDIPKKIGYKPAKYGDIKTQTNPYLKDQDTHMHILRKKEVSLLDLVRTQLESEEDNAEEIEIPEHIVIQHSTHRWK